MAELHVIGEISGATGFPSQTTYCKWTVHTEGSWELIEGLREGQTQIDNPLDSDEAVWSHPIDLHFATRGLKGWPKLHFEVWHHDNFGRNEIYGYGFCHIPTSPGFHDLSCVTWKPTGDWKERIRSYFVGGGLVLRNSDIIFSGPDRYKLNTVAMGTIHMKLGIILRNFDKFGIECG